MVGFWDFLLSDNLLTGAPFKSRTLHKSKIDKEKLIFQYCYAWIINNATDHGDVNWQKFHLKYPRERQDLLDVKTLPMQKLLLLS